MLILFLAGLDSGMASTGYTATWQIFKPFEGSPVHSVHHFVRVKCTIFFMYCEHGVFGCLSDGFGIVYLNLPTHMMAYVYNIYIYMHSQQDKALIFIKWWHQTMYREEKTAKKSGTYFAAILTLIWRYLFYLVDNVLSKVTTCNEKEMVNIVIIKESTSSQSQGIFRDSYECKSHWLQCQLI